MSSSRLETNILRLLSQCELNAKNGIYDWRLSKYVESVEIMMEDLIKRPNKPSKEMIIDCNRRIEFLRRLIQSQETTNSVEKAVHAQLLSNGVPTYTDTTVKEIYQRTCSKYDKDVRSQLFNLDKSTSGKLLDKQKGEDIDSLLKYHHNMQEKIAEDMLLLVRNLKEQSQLAGDIIKRDTEVTEKAIKVSDDNFSKLKSESAKLEEHSRKAWKCWLWVIMAVVMIIFINMVLFMKVTRKI